MVVVGECMVARGRLKRAENYWPFLYLHKQFHWITVVRERVAGTSQGFFFSSSKKTKKRRNKRIPRLSDNSGSTNDPEFTIATPPRTYFILQVIPE